MSTVKLVPYFLISFQKYCEVPHFPISSKVLSWFLISLFPSKKSVKLVPHFPISLFSRCFKKTFFFAILFLFFFSKFPFHFPISFQKKYEVSSSFPYFLDCGEIVHFSKKCKKKSRRSIIGWFNRVLELERQGFSFFFIIMLVILVSQHYLYASSCNYIVYFWRTTITCLFKQGW